MNAVPFLMARALSVLWQVHTITSHILFSYLSSAATHTIIYAHTQSCPRGVASGQPHPPSLLQGGEMSYPQNMANVTTSINTPTSVPRYKSVHYKAIPEENEDEQSGSSETPSYRRVVYRVYKWRWFMLASLCILNVSNGMVRRVSCMLEPCHD